MFKQEQHNNIGAPTYRQPLLQAMKVFLMVPFLEAQKRRAKRWTWPSAIFQAILMAYDRSASLKDRFQYARQCLMEMFHRRRLGTRLFADDALELAPPCAVDCRCGIRRVNLKSSRRWVAWPSLLGHGATEAVPTL